MSDNFHASDPGSVTLTNLYGLRATHVHRAGTPHFVFGSLHLLTQVLNWFINNGNYFINLTPPRIKLPELEAIIRKLWITVSLTAQIYLVFFYSWLVFGEGYKKCLKLNKLVALLSEMSVVPLCLLLVQAFHLLSPVDACKIITSRSLGSKRGELNFFW